VRRGLAPNGKQRSLVSISNAWKPPPIQFLQRWSICPGLIIARQSLVLEGAIERIGRPEASLRVKGEERVIAELVCSVLGLVSLKEH